MDRGKDSGAVAARYLDEIPGTRYHDPRDHDPEWTQNFLGQTDHRTTGQRAEEEPELLPEDFEQACDEKQQGGCRGTKEDAERQTFDPFGSFEELVKAASLCADQRMAINRAKKKAEEEAAAAKADAGAASQGNRKRRESRSASRRRRARARTAGAMQAAPAMAAATLLAQVQ